MNERIKELAEKAGMRTVCYEQDEDTHFTDALDVEKFAASIIRDVVATVKRTQVTSPDFEWAILNNYHLEIQE